MKPVLALNMWFPIQFKEASFKVFRFAYTVAIFGIAPCHHPPELCVSRVSVALRYNNDCV